jgi:hypothetical protein
MAPQSNLDKLINKFGIRNSTNTQNTQKFELGEIYFTIGLYIYYFFLQRENCTYITVLMGVSLFI